MDTFHLLFFCTFFCIVLTSSSMFSGTESYKYSNNNFILKDIISSKDPVVLRKQVVSLTNQGQYRVVEGIIQAIFRSGNLAIENGVPSMYHYLGVSLFYQNRLPEAASSFAKAILVHDNDLDSWMNLGDTYLSQMKVANACWAYENAIILRNLTTDVTKLYKARSWIVEWTDREILEYRIRKDVEARLANNMDPGILAADFSIVPGKTMAQMNRLAIWSKPSNVSLTNRKSLLLLRKSDVIKIGFVSGDYGVHPVSSLIRGLIDKIDKSKFEVYCFSMTQAESWWFSNISSIANKTVLLSGKDRFEAAVDIASYGIHILIDLSGHTLNSGLSTFSFRPAPIQVSFLGYPLTTGASFIDYYITDSISAPPEIVNSFTEKLVYQPSTYLVNDYLQMMGHTLTLPRPKYADARFSVPRHTATIFACFSNWQKIDPSIFRVWMNILRRVPNSVLWFLQHSAYEEARGHLENHAYQQGINPKRRIIFSPKVAWINHTWTKRVADIVLDTKLKNGHTTIMDSLWAGVPMVTIQGGNMGNRVASSLANAIGVFPFVTYSLREYEELVVQLALRPHWLTKYRETLEFNRLHTPLFDTFSWTRAFEKNMHAMITQSIINVHKVNENKHIIATKKTLDEGKYPLRIHSALNFATGLNSVIEAIRLKKTIRLNFGGNESKDGWFIIDIEKNQNADIHSKFDDLHQFPDHCVNVIYASQVLQQYSHEQAILILKEWNRVLQGNGSLYLSVVDMASIGKLWLESSTDLNMKMKLIKLAYEKKDEKYHIQYFYQSGYDFQIVQHVLEQAGFCHIHRQKALDLFQETKQLFIQSVSDVLFLHIKATPCDFNKIIL